MYELCREAYRAKGKGQRARGSTYETRIHIYSFNGRIFFCIMQFSRGAPILSDVVWNIGSNSTREEKQSKKKKKRGEKKKESAMFLCVAENGMITRDTNNREGDASLWETTLLKRRIIIIVTRSYGGRRIVKVLSGEEFWTGSKPAREFRKFKLHGHTRKKLAGINHHRLK